MLTGELGEGGALDVLHHQPAPVGLGVGDDVEDGDHVRVVELGAQPRLALGPREVGAVRAREQADLLERDRTPEHLVPPEPDRAHATSTDLPVERVPAGDHSAWLTELMLKSGTRSAGVAVREK